MERERQEQAERETKPELDSEFEQDMPPVWPGDEKQPWFRRERGLPPLPESRRPEDSEQVDLDELPTGLAELRTRVRAFGLSFVLPNLIGLIPVIGFVFGTAFAIVNLFLYRQGQDVGALVFKLRVVRDNGDVAGFFTMFVRSAASVISFLLLGAGYWTAYSDPYRRTWHDKWLGTYVVDDSPEYNNRKRSSSRNAYNWFWIILLMSLAVGLMFALASGPVPETILEGTPTPEVPVDGVDAGEPSA